MRVQMRFSSLHKPKEDAVVFGFAKYSHRFTNRQEISAAISLLLNAYSILSRIMPA